MIKSAIFRQMVGGTLLLSAVCFASCTFDKTNDFPEPELSSEYVRVGAEVRSHIYSRAAGFTPLTKGQFVLTYPYQLRYIAGEPDNIYRRADVKFDPEKGIGITTYDQKAYDPDKESKIMELKWSDVAVPSTAPLTATFYLDNVPDNLDDRDAKSEAMKSKNNPLSTNQDSREVWFRDTDDDLPFQAGIYEGDYGPNDLLWGWSSATKNAKQIDFVGPDNPIHHNMARVKVVIKVQPREDNKAIVNLKNNVEMKITNLKLRPERFYRTTGILELPLDIDPNNNTLTLIDMTDGEGAVTGMNGDKRLEWKEINDNTEKKEEDERPDDYWDAEYTTFDFVLPPQDLVNDSSDERPHLVLTIPAEDAGSGDKEGTFVTFEAALPQYMNLVDENSDKTTRMQLSFMKEHILTINANIGPPDMQLDFAPVYVEDWVDMGEQPLDGTQDGIYTAEDFYKFLELYVEAIERNTTIRIEKYGYKTSSGSWNILFWGRPEMDYTKIENYLLIKLAQSTNIADKEKYTPDYINDLLAAEKEAGKTDTEGELAELRDAIRSLIDEKIPFSFAFNNYVIKVKNNPDDPEEINSEYSGASGQIRLYNLVTGLKNKVPGISSIDEFLAMISAYNGSGIKQNYGAYDNSEERWVFELTEELKEPLVFEYNDLYGVMDHSATNSGGNFAINLRDHTITINCVYAQEDKGDPNKEQTIELSGEEGATLLHAILSKPKGLYTPGDVDWLIKAYQSLDDSEIVDNDGNGDDTVTDDELNTFDDYRWILDQYGTWSDANNKWTFNFRRTMTIEGPTIYGEMVPNEEKGLPDYVFQRNGTTIRVSDGGAGSQYLYSLNEDYLKRMFAKGGHVTEKPTHNNTTGVTTYDLEYVYTYANNGNPIYRRLYGYYNEEELRWDYPIIPDNENITIDYDRIWDKLKSPERMEFIFVDEEKMVTITGVPGIGNLICRGLQGATILQNIMRGIKLDIPEPGIETQGDFRLLFEAYNNNKDEANLSLYGTKDEDTGKWTFGFTPTADEEVVVDDYNNLYGKLNGSDGNFAFSFGDRKLRIKNLPDNGGEIVLSGYAGEVLLRTIVLAQGSITSPEEFTWLINAYNGQMATYSLAGTRNKASVPNFRSSMNNLRPNTSSFGTSKSAVAPLADEAPNNYDWLLSLFGTKDGDGAWTFKFSGTMTLNGPDIYGRMVPDGSGKPDYKFSYASGGVRVVDDESTAVNVNPENLRRLLSNGGKVTTKQEFDDMITAAQNDGNIITRRFYGVPDASDKMEYKIAESLTGITWSSINGVLNAEKAADFKLTFESEDIKVDITNLPLGYRPIECKGLDGAETLYTILRGKYPQPNPGIESETDFADMITAYGSGSEDLWIYGNLDDNNNKWTFYIHESLELIGENIYGKMVPGTDYDFVYSTDVTVKVTDDNNELSVKPEQLKVLMSNGGKVTNTEEFDKMITAAKNDGNIITRRFYGVPDASDNMQYKIDGIFEVDYSIFGDLEDADDDFSFSFTSNAKVTVSGLPGPREIVCTGTQGAKTLHDILTGDYTPEVGIQNKEEISKLITAYQANKTEDLAAFGTQSSDKWTFKFLNAMTLDGSIFGSMIPGSGKPDYEFDLNGQVISVTDGATEKPTAAELKKLFAASGKITSDADLTEMINGNSITRRYYGKNVDGNWTFPITNSITIAYSAVNEQLKNKFDSGEDFSFSFESGVSVTVINLPGGRQVVCDETILHDILVGDYTPEVGILEDGDVAKMIAAYKNGDNTELAAYGAVSGGVWEFTFRKSMELTGGNIYGEMNGTTEYSFEYDTNVTITVNDGEIVTVPKDKLKVLFAASGEIKDSEDFLALFDANAVKRHYYGSQTGSNWTFPITGSVNVDYNAIASRFAENNVFSLASGVEVTVTNVPKYTDGTTETMVFNADNIATLYAILSGSYTPSEPPTPPTPDPGDGGDDGDDNGGDDNGGSGNVQP